MPNLHNKIALITGASRGIGRAILTELAEQGATVIGTATSAQGAAQIDDHLKSMKAPGTGMVLNVKDISSIEHLMSTLTEQFGAPNILVNNAGIVKDNLMLRMKPEEWTDVIETNLNALYHVTKPCLRGMLKQSWGRIINVTSIIGSMGGAGQANYAAAKAGMIGFTKSLALELASRNITVNAVAPGFIETDMTDQLDEAQKKHILSNIPQGRIGKPEEIAHLVGFLASDHAAYITGQTVHVNGGLFLGG